MKRRYNLYVVLYDVEYDVLKVCDYDSNVCVGGIGQQNNTITNDHFFIPRMFFL